MAKAYAVDGGSFRVLFVSVFIAVFFVSVGRADASPNTDSMLGYWKFDGNVTDSSGDGSTASLAGTSPPTYDTQTPSTSFANTGDIRFNGTNSSLTFSNQPGLRPVSSLSVSFWLNFSAMPSGAQVIVGNYSASYPSQGFSIQANTSSLIFKVGDGTTSVSATLPITDVPVTTWHLVTATWDGAQVKLYVDRTSVSSATANLSAALSYANTTFSAGNFNGRMDDLRLYKRVLSPAEISDLAAGKHTTATWIGATDTSYELPANWDISAVPDPFTLVIIGNASNQPQLGASESLAGLDIPAGSSLDLRNYNLTFNDAGTFSNSGSLLLDNTGTQLLSGFTNSTASGTVVVNSSANVSGFATGNSYYNLTLNGTGTVNLAAALAVHGTLTVNGGTLGLSGSGSTVGGNLVLTGGTLSGGTAILSVAGDWQRTDGVFDCGTGSVVLNGSGQTVTGSNTFFNLTKTAQALDRLAFGAGDTQTVANVLTLHGVSDAGPLSLWSSSPGTQWGIDLRGTPDFAYLDVKDSDNVGANPIDVTGLTVVNNSNNTRWVFDHAAPVVTLDPVDSTTTDQREPVSGTVSDASSTVASVEFQVDSVTGSWSECVAVDGNFDSATERFTCTPSYDLDHAKHVYYFRATDAGGYVTTGDFVTATITIERKDDGGSSHDSGSSDSGLTAASASPAIATSSDAASDGGNTPAASSSDAGSGSGPVDAAVAAEIVQKADHLGQTSSDWRSQYFGSATCSDPNRCGDLADPDGDGLTNAQEYLLGTDPNDADTDHNGVRDSDEFAAGENPVTGSRIRYESPKTSGRENDSFKVDTVEAVDGNVKTLRFGGTALPDSYVTLYVYSDLPTILTVKTDENGNWSYTLDKELGNGDHQVYVGITDSAGRVIVKSEPLAFIKTAEAVSVIPAAQAAPVSVAEKSSGNYILFTVVISSAGLLIILVSIGFIVRNNRRKANETDNRNTQTAV